MKKLGNTLLWLIIGLMALPFMFMAWSGENIQKMGRKSILLWSMIPGLIGWIFAILSGLEIIQLNGWISFFVFVTYGSVAWHAIGALMRLEEVYAGDFSARKKKWFLGILVAINLPPILFLLDSATAKYE